MQYRTQMPVPRSSTRVDASLTCTAPWVEVISIFDATTRMTLPSADTLTCGQRCGFRSSKQDACGLTHSRGAAHQEGHDIANNMSSSFRTSATQRARLKEMQLAGYATYRFRIFPMITGRCLKFITGVCLSAA